MRLHPAKDGLIPQPDERGLTVRDKGGNTLIDLHDPTTGFCVGVTSPLTSTGMSVFPAKSCGGGNGPDIRKDEQSERYYELVRSSHSAPVGIVVRLTTDEDALLPTTRVRVIQAAPSTNGKSERKSTAPVQKKPSVRSENNAAVKAILSAMGFKGKVTPQIRDACLAMIEMEKSVSGRK